MVQCQRKRGYSSTSEYIRWLLARDMEETLGIPVSEALAGIPTRASTAARLAHKGGRGFRRIEGPDAGDAGG